MENIETTIEELTLVMLYLTSGVEQHKPVRRSWKGYTFHALDSLNTEGLIQNSRKTDNVVITDDGVEEAKRLLQKYGIDYSEPERKS
jgi:hypothetical protein